MPTVSLPANVKPVPFCCTAVLLFLLLGPRLRAGGLDGGYAAGLSFSIGNKITGIGLFLNTWAAYDFIQVNPGMRVSYHFRNLGVPHRHWELVCHGGLLLAWGKRQNDMNPFINSVSNHTKRPFSFAYAYSIYRDGVQTGQSTGTVAVQLHRLSLISENDIVGDNKDRFRTAAVAVQYRHGVHVYGISAVLWTGEKGEHVADAAYPSRNGYRKPARYGRYAHGILCLQANRYMGFGQELSLSAGVDAEQVRHVLQNKIIHDWIFIPEKWVHHPSAHVPMLDTDGNMYLYTPGQQVRKPSPYVRIAANPSLFY